jgi:hypothetical protein
MKAGEHFTFFVDRNNDNAPTFVCETCGKVHAYAAQASGASELYTVLCCGHSYRVRIETDPPSQHANTLHLYT